MSYYTTAIEGIPKMLLSIENPMEGFKRKQFPDVFKAYYEAHRPTLEAIENGYNTVVDKEQFLTNMGYALADAAKESIDKKPKKSQREKSPDGLQFLSGRLYLSGDPGISGASTEILVQKVGEAWKDRFPRSMSSLLAMNRSMPDLSESSATLPRRYAVPSENRMTAMN